MDYFIIRALLIEESVAIGILKINNTYRVSKNAAYYMTNLHFRKNKRAVMLYEVWKERISEPEYSTYLEMGILQDIKSGYHFVSDCGLHIYSKEIDTDDTISTQELIDSNIKYFLTNYKIPV